MRPSARDVREALCNDGASIPRSACDDECHVSTVLENLRAPVLLVECNDHTWDVQVMQSCRRCGSGSVSRTRAPPPSCETRAAGRWRSDILCNRPDISGAWPCSLRDEDPFS